ncbi:MAG TPA: hypothetical protein PKH09_07530, partial [Parvularculaceae bacterium]|nr:hypothetical protein [Parvularculaceae bacterium]
MKKRGERQGDEQNAAHHCEPSRLAIQKPFALGVRQPIDDAAEKTEHQDFADGDLKLKSGNGRIGITNASFGVCDARSSFGAIAAGGLRGDSVTLNSGNGSVEIAGAKTKTVDLYSSFG